MGFLISGSLYSGLKIGVLISFIFLDFGQVELGIGGIDIFLQDRTFLYFFLIPIALNICFGFLSEDRNLE